MTKTEQSMTIIIITRVSMKQAASDLCSSAGCEANEMREISGGDCPRSEVSGEGVNCPMGKMFEEHCPRGVKRAGKCADQHSFYV